MYHMIDLAEHCHDNKHCKIGMVTTEGPWYPRRFEEFPNEMTQLIYACAERHLGMVKTLLKGGAPFEECLSGT